MSGSLTGIFVSSRPLTALKSAVLAPMPSASDRTTTAVQPLALQQHADGVTQILEHGLLDESASFYARMTRWLPPIASGFSRRWPRG